MMNMKTLLCLALGASLSFSLLAACGGGSAATPAPETTAPAQTTPAVTEPAGEAAFTTVEEGKLILSTNSEFPPYEMLADGEGYNGTGLEGIDIEVAGAIAEKLGLELQIDDMGFDAALEAAQNGKSDMVMAGVTITEDRLQVLDFTDSYATGVQVVIVKEGSDVTMDNLGEKMIGTQMGTTGFLYASDTPENGGYGEEHVIGYDNGAIAVQALVNGQIDAVIIDDKPAQAYVEANPGLTTLPGEWVVEDYAIGVAKGNTALLEAINAAMAELKADGTFQAIVDKYIKAD